MPRAVSALIREAWNEVDASGNEIVAGLITVDLFDFFSHARSTFKDHLLGTFGILSAWGQPTDVCRCGLFHTAYSGDLFQFYVFDAGNDTERGMLRAIIGDSAEHLTWLFGTTHRGALLGLSNVMNRTTQAPPMPMSVAPEDKTVVHHRLHGTVSITNREIAKVIIVTLADYLEQMVEVNGWRDHHQVDSPTALYPGDGKPALALYWISQMCRAVRPHLEVVPAIFDGCSAVITHEAEAKARDKYWHVVLHEVELTDEEQLSLLAEAVSLNPFVGEPYLLTAQLHFRRGDHALAKVACAIALDRFYSMATAWDKRRSFGAWVAFARVLYVRAARAGRGLPSLPSNDNLPPTSTGLKLVSIDAVVSEMP